MSGIKAMKPQIGFVGLGNMGKFMAINLANALHKEQLPKLQIWNRTTSKSEEVAKESNGNAHVQKDVIALAKACDLVFTSLANDQVVESVYMQLFENAKTDALFVEMSTVYPTTTTKLVEKAKSANINFVSALPFGQPPVAKTAQLVFAIAGESQAVNSALKYIVPYMGRKAMQYGDDPAKASAFKLIGNSFILSTVEMITESMTLAEKAGIGADRVFEWLQEFYPAPSAINYGNKIANLKFEATGGFDLQGGLKDAKHIQRLGRENNCEMHIVGQAVKHLEQTIDINKGKDAKDWAALCAAQRQASGLPPFSR